MRLMLASFGLFLVLLFFSRGTGSHPVGSGPSSISGVFGSSSSPTMVVAPYIPTEQIGVVVEVGTRVPLGEAYPTIEAYHPTPGPSASGFQLSENGPQGCPVRSDKGRIVMTQGYGVGTHAPASVWGAVDLAVDGDGDGYAEPGSSWDAEILASHDGVVTATPNSYPGGNHIWVSHPGGVWKTGYAHLSTILVSSGQEVRAGDVIGLLGSSGASSGPHLDYQVWKDGVNIDPTWLVGC